MKHANDRQISEASVPAVCRIFQKKGGRLARRQGQIIPRGDHRWLVHVCQGRDPDSRRRRYSLGRMPVVRATEKRTPYFVGST